MKRLLASILTMTMLFSPALAAETGTDLLLPVVREYPGFSDVAQTAWYSANVEICYETGLLSGTTNDRFSPNSYLTEAECLTIAGRIHHILQGGDGVIPTAPENWGRYTLHDETGESRSAYADSQGWQQTPVSKVSSADELRLISETDIAWGMAQNGLSATLTFEPSETAYPGTLEFIAAYADQPAVLRFHPTDAAYTAGYSNDSSQQSIRPVPGLWYRDTAYYLEQQHIYQNNYPYCGASAAATSATRYGFIQALNPVVESLLTPAINTISALPDVSETGLADILPFYNAGILTGTDQYGTFSAWLGLTRGEAAAMVSRLACPALRQSFTPQTFSYADYTLTPLDVQGGDVDYLRFSGSSWWPPQYRNNGNLLSINWHVQKDGQEQLVCGLMDKAGTIVSQGYYYDYPSPSGLIRVTQDNPTVPSGFITGVIDATGKIVLPLARYDYCVISADGYLVTKRDITDPSEGYILWDSTGKKLRTLYNQYGQADWSGLSNNRIPYFDKAAEENGYLDQTGKIAITAVWDSVGAFSEGLAAVCQDGLWGYIDTTGKLVVPCQFDQAAPFSEGYAVVSLDGKFGAVDKHGKLVLPCQYLGLSHCSDGLFSYWRVGDMGWISPTGASFSSNYGGDLYCNGYLAAGRCYLNKSGQPITPAAFDWTGPVDENGSAFVSKDGQVFVITFPK